MDNKEIGGYFSLELSAHSNDMHSSGVYVNSGRNALEYILKSLVNINKIWIPYFTCEVILEPIIKLNIPYSFYSINISFEIVDTILLKEDEYLLVNNYFGIKDNYIESLADKYGDKLIVDNAQSLYSIPISGINTFYSPRKFVGLPDGGIVYSNNDIDYKLLEYDFSNERCSHLLKRLELNAQIGYKDFKNNSSDLKNQPIKKMSLLTRKIMSTINFDDIKNKRLINFNYLHNCLKSTNLLDDSLFNDLNCPMVYPYLVDDKSCKEKLIKNNIYVATYWPNVLEWCNHQQLEYLLSSKLVAIPIDQRYNIYHMYSNQKIINNVEL